MSALGQKQTFAMQNAMSALPPTADMCSALGNVRLVPEADIESGIRFTENPEYFSRGFRNHKLNGLLPRLAATLLCKRLMHQVLC